jgi:hypothetical protein
MSKDLVQIGAVELPVSFSPPTYTGRGTQTEREAVVRRVSENWRLLREAIPYYLVEANRRAAEGESLKDQPGDAVTLADVRRAVTVLGRSLEVLDIITRENGG